MKEDFFEKEVSMFGLRYALIFLVTMCICYAEGSNIARELDAIATMIACVCFQVYMRYSLNIIQKMQESEGKL